MKNPLRKSCFGYFLVIMLFCGAIPRSHGQLVMKNISRLCEKEMGHDDRKNYKKAVSYYESRDYKQSLSLLNMLTSSSGSNLCITKLLADTYFQDALYSDAITEYNQLIEKADMTLNEVSKHDAGWFGESRHKQTIQDLKNLKTYANAQIITCEKFLKKTPLKPYSDNKVTQDTAQNRVQDGELAKATSLLDDKCWNNIEYEDSSWITFNRQESDDLHLKQLQKHVRSLAKKKYGGSGVSALETIDAITCSNLSWIKETGTTRYQWFEDLKKQEDRVLQQRLEIRNYQSDKLKIEGDIESIHQTIQLLESRKKSIDDDISFQKQAQNEIWEGYYKKMATIPQSNVLIGMAKAPDEDSTQLENRIVEKMQLAAVELVSDNILQKKTLTLDKNLIEIIRITKSGRARITAQYYRTSKHYLKGNQYLFKILQIEVTPLDTGYINPKVDILPSDEEISVYNVISPDSIFLITNGISVKTARDKLDIQSNSNELDHLKMFCESTRNQNKNYKEKSDEALMQYMKDKDQSNNKITKLLSIKDSILSEIGKESSRLESLEAKLKLHDAADTTLYNNLSMYQKSYDSVLSSMTDYKSKLSSSLSQNIQDETTFANTLALECFQSVNKERKSGQSEITITASKTTLPGRDRKIKHERYQVHLVPELEAFKVLSLYRVKNSNSSGFEVSLFLNVAFKLHYKETSRERKVPDEYTDKSGTSGRDSDYSVIPSIRADGKTKQFRDGNTIWQFYPGIQNSYIGFLDKQDPLLRLPTITELRNFFNRLAYQQESGIKIFSELFTFQEESALFATSEILSGTDLIKCLRVSRYNLSVTEEIIDIGEEANFLLIKKNIP